MLLAIDIGNTNTVIGIFDGETLRDSFRVSSSQTMTSDEAGFFIQCSLDRLGIGGEQIEEVIIGSVVPPLTPVFEATAKQYCGCIPIVVSACDIGLVTLRKTPLFQEVLPSKIFEYLGMERPVIISVDGEARRLVEDAGAGTFVPPEDVDALASAIRRMAARPDELQAMGRAGRSHVLAHYDRKTLAERYAAILQ
ncbi:MAG: type III pantothenate kinase, partial [Candidatus Zixiibacteriota bacterium]